MNLKDKKASRTARACKDISPFRLMATIIISVFIAEAFVMLLLLFFPSFPPAIEALMDAALLSILAFPVLYVFSFRPMVLNLVERKRAEENLCAANQQLQASEQQLKASNQQLQATEQQLRAMNQQLNAGNQQLVANEQHLKAANHRAEELAKKAKEASEFKSTFLANMSHEIRTPMNGVIGMLDLALDEQLNKKVRDYLLTSKSSAGILLSVINDILDISKIEAGKLNVEIIDCSLNDILADVNSLMRPRVAEKWLEFDIIFDTPVPEKICTDPTRVRQCLLNLISNAIKFTEKGYIRVHVSSQGNTEQNSRIRFDVEDSGIGISPQQQHRIFNAFNQADASTTRRFGGTGLGLAIVKQLSNLLDGEISVKSQVDKGSTFSLIIPAGVEVGAEGLITKCKRIETTSNRKTEIKDIKMSGKILVAEDDPVNQMTIKAILEKANLDVTIASDGLEAVERADSEQYDLVLMDMHMPKMNGCDATKTLRQKGFDKPIVALTASVMKSDLDQYIKAGCNECQAKPINRRKLFETLAKYLSCSSGNVSDKVDQLKSQVDELNELVTDGKSEMELSMNGSESQIPEDAIDVQGLLDEVEDRQLVKEMIGVFLKSNGERIDRLGEVIKAADTKELTELAHSLKGAAGTLQVTRLAQLAHQLEDAGIKGDLKTAEELLVVTKAEFERCKAFVSQPNWIG